MKIYSYKYDIKIIHLFQVTLLLFSCLNIYDSVDPIDCCTPGFPVLHYLLELAQTQVH